MLIDSNRNSVVRNLGGTIWKGIDGQPFIICACCVDTIRIVFLMNFKVLEYVGSRTIC